MTVSVSGVTVDCGDAATLARFWSAALDLPLDPDPSPEFASVNRTAAELPRFLFARVPEGKTAKNRMHLDLAVDGSAAHADEVARLVELGATTSRTRRSGATRGRCSPIRKATSSVSLPSTEHSMIMSGLGAVAVVLSRSRSCGTRSPGQRGR